MTNHETLAAMQRWDYKAVVLTGGFMGRHNEELRRAPISKGSSTRSGRTVGSSPGSSMKRLAVAVPPRSCGGSSRR
jgi:hypothetical protein